MMVNVFSILLLTILQSVFQQSWVSELEKKINITDDKSRGEIGVYIKNLEDNKVLNYHANENWYYASTVKIMIAIAVLQKAEAGEISLDDELILKESDFVDGSGDLLYQKPGKKYTIRTLIEKMIKDSDSTAADMLIRLISEDGLNKQISDKMGIKINTVTSIMQVRYDAYSEIHKNAQNLTNKDIIEINNKDSYGERFNELLVKMKVEREDVKARSIEEAFTIYYKKGLNSGTLEAMGQLLERFYERSILSEKSTEFLLETMADISTGDRRIKAGLPERTRFVQKTGTQVNRICNVGIIFPEGKNKPIIIAACVKDFETFSEAETALENVGRALTEVLLE